MIAQILRVTFTGILAGALLFAIPFLLFKAFFFFLFIGLAFRLIAGGRHRRWRHFERNTRYYYPYEGKEGLKDHFYQNPKNV